jgi:hypothetical protein
MRNDQDQLQKIAAQEHPPNTNAYDHMRERVTQLPQIPQPSVTREHHEHIPVDLQISRAERS